MDFDSLYLRVLKFLNFRPRSEKEIRDYLKEKLRKLPEIDSSLIDLIIYKLKQQKFLNDQEFAKMWIRSRTEYKPKGERLIRMELIQKGIGKDMIDAAFAAYDVSQKGSLNSERSEVDMAVGLLEKRKKKYEGMDKMERFNKAGSMLARRGFDLDDIKAAIDRVFGKMV